jgi:glucan phosphoethanolaminetransferase (alkaline phosphatase superfamily)
MKIVKYITLAILGILVFLSGFFILALLASSHRVSQSTKLAFVSFFIGTIIVFILAIYFFDHKERKVKSNLTKISKSLPNFENSQEGNWFKEEFQHGEWGLALESIEYYISENQIQVDSNTERLISELNKRFSSK